MKSQSLIAILVILLSNAAALAQESVSEPPAASATAATPGGDFTAQRRECRQRARQTDDPQERRRILRECRQEAQNSNSVAAPLPTPTPAETPPTVEQPSAITAPAPSAPSPVEPPPAPTASAKPSSQSSPTSEATAATPSAAELREQRQQRREQRQQRREQQAQDGTSDVYSNAAASQTHASEPQTRDLTVQDEQRESAGGGNRGGVRYGGLDVGDENGTSWNGGLPVWVSQPRALSWQTPAAVMTADQGWRDDAGPGNRSQRLRQLERRVDAIERMLQDVLNNQRRLLNAAPASGR